MFKFMLTPSIAHSIPANFVPHSPPPPFLRTNHKKSETQKTDDARAIPHTV